jgi:hypothetical protein
VSDDVQRLTDEDQEIMANALKDYLGRPYPVRSRIGQEVAPGAVVTGPKRLPRKLKKSDKKKCILRVTVSIFRPPQESITCTIGWSSISTEDNT